MNMAQCQNCKTEWDLRANFRDRRPSPLERAECCDGPGCMTLLSECCFDQGEAWMCEFKGCGAKLCAEHAHELDGETFCWPHYKQTAESVASQGFDLAAAVKKQLEQMTAIAKRVYARTGMRIWTA